MKYYLTLAMVVFIYMNFWFIISLIKKRNDIADIAWGLGFVLLSWVAFFINESLSTKSVIVNLLVTLWGLRLAWHILQRNKDKAEVDFVIHDGKYITGIEVKASATIQASDFKGLIKLRDAVDDSFANGVVFYDGDTILSFGDRLFAIPYAAFLAS